MEYTELGEYNLKVESSSLNNESRNRDGVYLERAVPIRGFFLAVLENPTEVYVKPTES